MINSKGSVVVGHEGPQLGLSAVVVVPDRGSECEEPLEHPGDHSVLGSPTVLFQVELAFERIVDRFDELAHGFEEPGTGTSSLVLASWSEQGRLAFVQEGLELGAGIALVSQDDLA